MERSKRDIVWLHGRLNGNKNLILGNHDTQLKDWVYFNKVCGFEKYKRSWLSHAPYPPSGITGQRSTLAMQYNLLTETCKPLEKKQYLMVAKFPDGAEVHWVVGRVLEDGVTYKVTPFHFLNTSDPNWQEQGAVFYWAEIPRVS